MFLFRLFNALLLIRTSLRIASLNCFLYAASSSLVFPAGDFPSAAAISHIVSSRRAENSLDTFIAHSPSWG